MNTKENVVQVRYKVYFYQSQANEASPHGCVSFQFITHLSESEIKFSHPFIHKAKEVPNYVKYATFFLLQEDPASAH